MKKLTLSFLALALISVAFSQEIPTYNSILGVESNHLSTDFSLLPDLKDLANFNYPKEVITSKLSHVVGSGQNDYQTTIEQKQFFDEEKLVEWRFKSYLFGNKGNVFQTTRKFFYDDQDRLIKYQYYDKGIAANEGYTYAYFPDGNIKYIEGFGLEVGKGKTFERKEENGLVYLVENNQNYERSYLVISTIGKKVKTIKHLDKKSGLKTESSYSYHFDEGDITFTTTRIVYKSPKEEVTYYVKNGNTLTRKSTQNLETNKTWHEVYYYTYDKYGNWVICRSKFRGENLDFAIRSQEKIFIRKIVYQNGEVTGYDDPKNSDLKSELEKIRLQIFSDRDIAYDEGAKWEKIEGGAKFLFFVDGQNVSSNCYSYILKDNLVVFNRKTGKLYNCVNFKNKPEKKSYSATSLNIDTSNGFWYKSETGGLVAMSADGNYVTEYEINKYDTNGVDVLYQPKGNKNLLLAKNFKNIEAMTVAGFQLKNTNLELTDIEDYSWEKNEDGSSYWLYINNKSVAAECKSILYYEGNYVVYYPVIKQFFELENYDASKANELHKAKIVNVNVNNGFWHKMLKDGKENYALYNSDGNETDYSVFESFQFDNDGNYIGYKKDGSKVVLENAKTISPYVIKPIVSFSVEKHGGANSNSTLVYEEESDYTWKKNEAGAYWFYKNREAINNTKSFWNGSNLLVLDHTKNNLINLKGYKQGEPNITYKGYKLNVDFTDGFWFKTDANQFLAYDKNGNHIKDLEINKWAENKKDIIIKSKNSAQTYVLPGYSTAEINKVYSLKLEGYEKNVSNVYNDLAESVKNQIETTKSIAESSEKVLKNLVGECIKGDCNDGYGEKKWPSGNVAEGFFEKGKPYGPGLIIYKSGDQKFANFKDSWDNVEGFEYINYKDDRAAQFINYKSKIGIYYDDKNNEFWEIHLDTKTKILLKSNNDKYCLVGNCQDGVGLYKYSNGATYFGTFKNGRRHGFGDLRFPSGQYYIGEFVYDLKEGLGTYVWKEDNHYTGEWKNDTYHGKGIMSYSKTNYQAGLWENGKYSRSLDSKN